MASLPYPLCYDCTTYLVGMARMPYPPKYPLTFFYNRILQIIYNLYKKLGFDIKDFPNAYHMFENEITLPLNTKMTDEDLEYVIENFVEIVLCFFYLMMR